MGISNDKQNRALLLHHGGPEVDEIFDTVQDVGEDKDYKKAVEKLTAHFSPQVNVTYEVYNFRQAMEKGWRNPRLFPHTSEKPSEEQIQTKEIKEQIIFRTSLCKNQTS